MKQHWQYLKYVLRHKWFVFLECCKLGIIWRGIIHDWTKLTPSEWNGYVYRFTRGNGYDIESLEYLYAFSHHLNKCRHHWQHWAYVRNDGTIRYLPMPEKARLEMLADLRAMSRQFGTDVRAWYSDNYDEFHLHSETRNWLDVMMHYLPSLPSEDAINA